MIIFICMEKVMFYLAFITAYSYAQIPDSTMVGRIKIPSKLINEVTLSPLKLSSKEKLDYLRLKQKVIKVYPYALAAKKQIDELDVDLSYVKSKRHKRKLSRRHAKWVKNNYSNILIKLTRTEGKILTKLIYLETGLSCYQLINKYRNRYSAGIWQTIAKIYDGDLKSTFAPTENQEDKWIEHILWQIPSSQLQD